MNTNIMELLEKKVLISFRKYMSRANKTNKSNDTWGNNDIYECVIEDSRIDGPAWNVTCDAFGNVYQVYKLGG